MIGVEADGRSSNYSAGEPVSRVDGEDVFCHERDGRGVQLANEADVVGHVRAMHTTWSTDAQPQLHEIGLKHHKVSLCHDASHASAPGPLEFLPAPGSDPVEKSLNDHCTLTSFIGPNLDSSRYQSFFEDLRRIARLRLDAVMERTEARKKSTHLRELHTQVIQEVKQIQGKLQSTLDERKTHITQLGAGDAWLRAADVESRAWEERDFNIETCIERIRASNALLNAEETSLIDIECDIRKFETSLYDSLPTSTWLPPDSELDSRLEAPPDNSYAFFDRLMAMQPSLTFMDYDRDARAAISQIREVMMYSDSAEMADIDWQEPLSDAQDDLSGSSQWFSYGRLPKQMAFQKQGIARNVLPIQIKDNLYDAVPDTGSLKNIISQDYARSIGVPVDRTKMQRNAFANAVGKKFNSLGEAILKFSFPDEPSKTYEETFAVVQRCAAPLVLGKSFLLATEIFSRFRHRLKKTVTSVSQPWRMMYAGSSGLRFSCTIDAEPVLANVDNGSEKDFVSLQYARSYQWKIARLPRHVGFVELADGTTTKVAGYVDAPLVIEGKTYLRRWYILHALVCDVLIGDETIEETDLFNTHLEHLLDTDDVDKQGAILLMTWIEELHDHFDNFLKDPLYEIPSSFDLSV